MFFFLFFPLFSLFLIIWGYDTFYWITQRLYRQGHIYNTSDSTKSFNCKELRQAGLICRQGDFKSEACLWISDWNSFGSFYSIVSCIVRVLTRDILVELLRMGSFIQSCYCSTGYSRRYRKWCGRSVSPLFPFLGRWFLLSLIFPESSFVVPLSLLFIS